MTEKGVAEYKKRISKRDALFIVYIYRSVRSTSVTSLVFRLIRTVLIS